VLEFIKWVFCNKSVRSHLISSDVFFNYGNTKVFFFLSIFAFRARGELSDGPQGSQLGYELKLIAI
jgi:hypothetical protein